MSDSQFTHPLRSESKKQIWSPNQLSAGYFGTLKGPPKRQLSIRAEQHSANPNHPLPSLSTLPIEQSTALLKVRLSRVPLDHSKALLQIARVPSATTAGLLTPLTPEDIRNAALALSTLEIGKSTTSISHTLKDFCEVDMNPQDVVKGIWFRPEFGKKYGTDYVAKTIEQYLREFAQSPLQYEALCSAEAESRLRLKLSQIPVSQAEAILRFANLPFDQARCFLDMDELKEAIECMGQCLEDDISVANLHKSQQALVQMSLNYEDNYFDFQRELQSNHIYGLNVTRQELDHIGMRASDLELAVAAVLGDGSLDASYYGKRVLSGDFKPHDTRMSHAELYKMLEFAWVIAGPMNCPESLTWRLRYHMSSNRPDGVQEDGTDYVGTMYYTLRSLVGDALPYYDTNPKEPGSVGFSTRQQKQFKFLAKLFLERQVVNGKSKYIKRYKPGTITKFLTVRGLAHWYMQDGGKSSSPANVNRKEISFATHCFSLTEVQMMCDELLHKFGLHARPDRNKGKYRIVISGHSFAQFKRLVKPFLLPSMDYKMPSDRQENSYTKDIEYADKVPQALKDWKDGKDNRIDQWYSLIPGTENYLNTALEKVGHGKEKRSGDKNSKTKKRSGDNKSKIK